MKWFRFYSETIHKPKVRRLSPPLFRTWVFLLCIASEGKPRGSLPEVSDLADQLRKPESRVQADLKELQRRGLLDEIDGRLVPHNWNERQPAWDDSTERQRKKRSRDKPVAPSRDSHRLEESRVEQTRTEQTRGEAEDVLPLLVKRYENEIGSLNPTIGDELKEWAVLIPDESFIEYAFKESSSNGVRSWKYVASIFRRLADEGWPTDFGEEEKTTDSEPDWLERRYKRQEKLGRIS